MQTTKRIFSLGTAALVLASLLAPRSHSQESLIPHLPSENSSSPAGIAGQLIGFRMEDRDDEDDDRREKSRENHRAKKDRKSEKYRKTHSEHREQAHAAPVQPEVLELLRNINRTLKSMETMMREDMEQDRKRPEQAFQPMMPPKFGPQNFNPSFEPGMPSPPKNRGPQPPNPDNRGPRNFAPRDDGRRDDGRRDDEPRTMNQER